MDIRRIREYMSKWSEYTYAQGVDFCREVSVEEKEQTKDVLKVQQLTEKKMDGFSVDGIPVKYEGSLKTISYTGIFRDALDNGYLTPASYAVRIVCACNKHNMNNDMTAGIVGRGLRTLPAFIREMDLASKLSDEGLGIQSYCGSTEDDIQGHTDVFLKFKGQTYRIWSYQDTSDRAINNTISKIKGNRGELPAGLYILCPFNYRDKNQYEEVNGWRLYNSNYIDKVKNVVINGEMFLYRDLVDGQYTRMCAYIKKINVFRKE